MTQWEGVMQKHAKSFYLASLFFPRQLLPRVKSLYALCRWLDDAVDEASSKTIAEENLQYILNDLRKEKPTLPPNSLYRSHSLDIGYIEDLAQGARDDLQTVRIQTTEDLVRYSYKVAGTVGLAMFDLMKVDDPKARAQAVDLGIAMQITNICRDVKEDLEMNRIYVPNQLLKKQGLDHEMMLSGQFSQTKLIATVGEMLELADRYYESAAKAFNNIPFRTRGAIIIATHLYRSIGLKLIRRGGNPMLGRTYLNNFEKSLVVIKGMGHWFKTLFVGKKSPDHQTTLHSGLEEWQALRGFKN